MAVNVKTTELLAEKNVMRLDRKAKKKKAITKAAIQLSKQNSPAIYEKMMKHYKLYKGLKAKLIKKNLSKAKAAVRSAK